MSKTCSCGAPASTCEKCAAEYSPAFVPSEIAALCLDCFAIFDGSRGASCPRCASRSSVGVEEWLRARRGRPSLVRRVA